jgi:hypothetical protein
VTRAGVLASAGLVGLVIACGAIAPPAGSPAPLNTCQADQDCAGYAQSGVMPVCQDFCQVEGESAGNWTAVITLAQNAPYGAGATFATPRFASLLTSPVMTTSGSIVCTGGDCGQLPALVASTDQNSQKALAGELLCSAQAAQLANFNLGGTEVAMPVRATFVPKWGTSPAVAVDAASLGLPILPTVANTIPNPGLQPVPGPGLGTGMEFYVAGGLPPLIYERTLAPLPPFDAVFPPDVSMVDLTAAPPPSENPLWSGFDVTLGTSVGGSSSFPTIAFLRADGGPLDGWTAYLRDIVTLRPFSQVANLGGTQQTVVLLTHHYPQQLASMSEPDALTGAQLVMVPPSNSLLPTWIYNAVNDEAAGWGTYPKLPPPVSVRISVVNQKQEAEPADLVFEAIDICRYAADSPTPEHDLLSANHDFAFVMRASAPTGSVEVELPLGGYRVTAVPRGPGQALTVVNPFALADANCNLVTPKAIQLASQSIVTGSAIVADMRPLADATVELVPTACADSEVDPDCMPRGTQTITTTSGTYSVPLDPGEYLLRVRPALGSALPWVVQPLNVSSAVATSAPLTTVPAPYYAGLQLFDFLGNPAADAIVRVFQNPATGVPYEIGEAITDATGHFDMYLDRAAQ